MAQAGASPNVIQTLIAKAGAKIDIKDELGETVLHAAVRRGGKDACKQLSILVQLGANLEAQNRKGDTPLELAAEQKDVAVFKHLVMLGAGEKAISSTINCFYQSLSKKEKQQLVPYITKLTQINPEVGWKISLNEIFPVQGKGKATLSTVTEGDRVISEVVWNSLFEKNGTPKKVNAYGVRSVSFVEKNGQRIYVKFFPQLPGTELSVIRLAENLWGYCAPYCELASINGIPVLLSQGVPGETLYEVLQKDPERLKQLDPESVSKALILAMLVNPGDGNLGNYIVSPFISQEGQVKYRLISIDNDQAFMPAVTKTIKTGFFGSTLSLQVKTILYCLDAMQEPVSQKLIQQIQEKDLVELLANWLSSLKIHHEAAKNHFDSRLLKKYQEDKASVIGVSFAPGMIKQLFTKLMRLQVALNKKTPPTHLELLSNLEPIVAHRYRSVLQDTRLSAMEKFKKVEDITEEQALTSSSNALPQLLVSREIPAIGELQAALWTGKYGPEQALQELKWVQEQHTNLEQIFKDLGKSKIQDVKELPASLLEKWLQEADLTKLSGPQQKVLLEAIKDHALAYVSLKNCASLIKNMLNSFKLEHIKKLDVSGCLKLKSISAGGLGGASLMMPALTNMRLDGTGVKSIRLQAEQLRKLSARNCSQLKSLELTATQLHRLDIREIPSFNREKIEAIFEQFPQAFIYLVPTLTFGQQACAGYLFERGKLHLGKQEYGLAAHYLIQSAEQGNHILDLSSTQIGDSGAQELAKALPSTQIHTLDLSDNNIGDSGAQELAKALPSTQIHTLNLCNNKIGDSGAQELAKALPSSQIHTLALHWNKIGALGAQELAKALPASQLYILDLRSNKIGASGAQELSKALPSSQIHTLDLSDNKIGDSGAQELSNALPSTQIHTLDLSSNKIGDSGAEELAKALPFTKIHTLHLRNNNIDSPGAQELAKALPNSQIHTLNLGFNHIDESGAEELAKALPNSKIHTLDLRYNNIGTETSSFLEKNFPHIIFIFR